MLLCALDCLTQILSHCALSLDAMASTIWQYCRCRCQCHFSLTDVEIQGTLDAPCKQVRRSRCLALTEWNITCAGLLRHYIALHWHIIFHRRINISRQRCSGTGSRRCADRCGAVCLFCESLLSISCLACAPVQQHADALQKLQVRICGLSRLHDALHKMPESNITLHLAISICARACHDGDKKLCSGALSKLSDLACIVLQDFTTESTFSTPAGYNAYNINYKVDCT